MGEAEYVRVRRQQAQTMALDVGNDKAFSLAWANDGTFGPFWDTNRHLV